MQAPGPNPEDDETTIENLRCGDPATMAYWLSRLTDYFRGTFSAIYEDAGDLANKTMEDAIKRLYPSHPSCYRRESSLRTWLFGIARIKGLHQLDRRKRRHEDKAVSLEELAETGWEPEADSVFAARLEEHEYWKLRLGDLDDEARELVRLWIEEDLPLAEVGRRLGISEDAVEGRCRRLKPKLRKWYEDEHGLVNRGSHLKKTGRKP